jgi:heme-degrading monooxygenase HmoA
VRNGDPNEWEDDMYVRTMYITADPPDVGPALDVIAKEGPGMLAEQEGYQGIGVFTDRTVGKILVGSWWDSEQAMKDSDERLRDRRTQMLAPFVSTIAVMGFEAAVYVRPSPATRGGFRMHRLAFDPPMADQLVQLFQEKGLPRLQQLDGFSGCSLLIDRNRGMASVGVVFKDMASMEATRGEQAKIRHEALSGLNWVQLIALEELEVVDLEIPTQ